MMLIVKLKLSKDKLSTNHYNVYSNTELIGHIRKNVKQKWDYFLYFPDQEYSGAQYRLPTIALKYMQSHLNRKLKTITKKIALITANTKTQNK